MGVKKDSDTSLTASESLNKPVNISLKEGEVKIVPADLKAPRMNLPS